MRAWAGIVAAAALASASAARADDARPEPPRGPRAAPASRPSLGDPFRRPVSAIEVGATAAVAGATLAGYLAVTPAPRWTTTNRFDLELRDGLRLASPRARNVARGVSDFLLAMQSAYVLAVDPAFAAWLGHGRLDVGARLLLIDLEALTLTSAMDLATVDLAGRERPYGRACTGAFAASDDCTGARRYQSFFSGHATTTFAGAGLTCAHHARLPLYGGGLADALACAGTVGVAATTAALRVAADQHWATDVIVGAVVGFGAGFALPSLAHYRASRAVEVAAAVTPFGAFAVGRF